MTSKKNSPQGTPENTVYINSDSQDSGAAPALDSIAKYVGQKSPTTIEAIAETPHQRKRSTRYKHQRAAAKLLPASRTAKCLWAVSSLQYGVDVIHNTAEERSRFSGLQTCGSVWACPCCSATISERRRDELNHLLKWAKAEGYFPVMATFTARHTRETRLDELVEGMRLAKRKLVQHRSYRTLVKPHLVGHVTASEVTGGGLHGWHPHYHQIFIVKAADAAAAEALIRLLQDPWLASLKGVGLSGTGQGFDVQNASAAGNYVAKWGAAEELTLTAKKEARSKTGRSPFQLLADYAERDDKQAGALFAEYAKVFKGLRQLVWSDGLKKLAGVDAMSDEEVAEQEVRLLDAAKSDTRTAHFTPKDWARVRGHRAAILKFSELAQGPGVDALVHVIKSSPPLADRGVGVVDPDVSEAETEGGRYPTVDIRGNDSPSVSEPHSRLEEQTCLGLFGC